MDDSGAILCQVSSLKDMLDQVNEEIEANIQITREIESEIVKCAEIETALAVRESELMKMVYMAEFEINGLMAVTDVSRCSEKLSGEEFCCLRMKRDEILKRMKDKREGFITSCLDFQRSIDKGENDELGTLLSEKESLENEVHLLNKKNYALQNSMKAFVEEILEDLHSSNSGNIVFLIILQLLFYYQELLVRVGHGPWRNGRLLHCNPEVTGSRWKTASPHAKVRLCTSNPPKTQQCREPCALCQP